MMLNQLLNLIVEYIKTAQYCCGILRENIPDGIPILGAYRQKVITKNGKIKGLTYNFHGVGCYFEFEDGREINIDFGPNDRCDGFDLYRLRFFLQHLTNKNSFSLLLNEGHLKEEFEKLITENIIYNPRWEPSPHLYYLLINH